MKDIIVGRVTQVIDLETIQVEISQVVRNDSHYYASEEIVRLNSLQNKLDVYRKISTKGFIEATLVGKGVMCLVSRRNPEGTVEADVYALGH